jgi:hypothetical protein
MADWSRIEEMKADYLAGDSLAAVARKYGLRRQTLSEKAHDLGWAELRRSESEDVRAKVRGIAAERKTGAALTIRAVADQLLLTITAGVADGMYSASASDLRAITAALKDLSEIKGDYSPLQRKKLEAQIASLKAQAKAAERENDAGGKIITVKLADGLDDLAE